MKGVGARLPKNQATFLDIGEAQKTHERTPGLEAGKTSWEVGNFRWIRPAPKRLWKEKRVGRGQTKKTIKDPEFGRWLAGREKTPRDQAQ